MNEVAESVLKVSKMGTIWGVVVLTLGIFSLITPMVSGLAVTLIVAAVLLASGIAQLIYAMRSTTYGSGIGRFILGVVAALCGLAMLISPAAGLASITLFLAIYFLMDGLFCVIRAFQMRPGQGWGWLAFSGLVSLVLGWMIYADWPLSGVWAVGILVGIRLVFAG